MRSLSIIKDVVRNTEGFLTVREGMFLYNNAKKCTKGKSIVEIGSWKGRSTICLAKGSMAGNCVDVYAIDPHIGSRECHDIFQKKNISTLQEFKNNIKKYRVSKFVKPLITTSEKAAKKWNKKIEFLWIDGKHSYSAALNDFKNWEPFLTDGGIIAFHDRFHNGPKKVIDENILKSRKFNDFGFFESIAYAKKVRRNSVYDRIKHRYIITANNLYIFCYKNLKIPRFFKSLGKKFIRMPYIDHSQ